MISNKNSLVHDAVYLIARHECTDRAWQLTRFNLFLKLSSAVTQDFKCMFMWEF